MAGPSARSTQKKRSVVQTDPSHQIVSSTGSAATTARAGHGRPRSRSRAPTMPAVSTPSANSAARSGGDWIT